MRADMKSMFDAEKYDGWFETPEGKMLFKLEQRWPG